MRVRIDILLVAVATSMPLPGAFGQLIRPKEDTVQVEFDRARDFSDFRTFSWMKEQKPAPNMANHIRITVAIQKQLQTLGLSPETKKPDVQVLYSVDDHSRVEFDAIVQRGPFGSSSTRVFGTKPRRVQERTLSVAIVDAETNAVVWYAAGSREVESPDKEERELTELVADLFAKFPKGKPKEK